MRIKMNTLRLIAAAALALLLIVVPAYITVANNQRAAALKKQLEALPLPPETAAVESLSLAGKLIGSGNGMQYLGALLIESDWDGEELQKYYAAHHCAVVRQTSDRIGIVDHGRYQLQKFDPDASKCFYLVYLWDSCTDGLLNLDIRGH